MRTVALLIVLALAVPSVAALVCDVACAAQHRNGAAAPQPASCHDDAAPQPESPSASGRHVCHEMGVVPASVMRDAASQAAMAPAIVRAVFDSAAEHNPGLNVVAPHARLTAHAPPLLTLPLRI
jgi:hypothetical protein